jgi:muconate cycloisomerase
MDPTNIHELMAAMDRAVDGFLDSKAAIEMACVDIAARKANVPVYTWLGGAMKQELLFNAWIGILPPDQAAAETVAWQKKGFRSAKVKVGGDIKADAARLKAIRAAVGPDFHLRIDANAGYDADTSIALAKLMEPVNLQLFEQPVPADDIAGMARVRRSTSIPIMADESVLDHASLIRIIKADAADIVKVKVMKQGGLLRTRQMIECAAAAGLRVVIGHGFGLALSTLAEAAVAATSAAVMPGCEAVGPLKMAGDVVSEPVQLGAGVLRLSDAPGIGALVDMEALNRYRVER